MSFALSLPCSWQYFLRTGKRCPRILSYACLYCCPGPFRLRDIVHKRKLKLSWTNPDVFDERPKAPKRPLAASTLRQQRVHLRLAASILIRNGEVIAALADLVMPERFKSILRYYHKQANGEPNAFAIGLAKTLIQVAQYHTGARSKQIRELKRLAGNLPSVPFDLTAKNKALLRQLESERVRAKLYFLPEQLMGEVAKDLDSGHVRLGEAQVAIAIDILLALPL